MKKYRALQIILELAEGSMLDAADAVYDDGEYDEMLRQTEAYHIVHKILKREVKKDENER